MVFEEVLQKVIKLRFSSRREAINLLKKNIKMVMKISFGKLRCLSRGSNRFFFCIPAFQGFKNLSYANA